MQLNFGKNRQVFKRTLTELFFHGDYKAIVDQVDRENETGYLLPFKTTIDNIVQYEIIFMGFPTWDMQLPHPMKSFLNQYVFSDKTIVPFKTNGGYGVGSSFETVKKLCPDSKIPDGYSLQTEWSETESIM